MDNKDIAPVKGQKEPLGRASHSEESAAPGADDVNLASKAAMFENKDRLSGRPTRKRPTFSAPSAAAINYQGITIYTACRQGNLPVCVLLWGIAAAKQVNLMEPDVEGNTPLHYACMAENNEALGFILQQTRGMLDASTKLVDSVNNAGETALLRSMVTAAPTVVKTLVDEKSDPLIKDKKGNTIFSVCAKAKQLWCMNMMYEHISSVFGEDKANELLRAKDTEFHGVFDWAADSGDINTIEWLLRKGLSPQEHDDHGRGALYWATKSRQVNAVRLLVFACGCDPHATNTIDGTSPLGMAKKFGDPELLKAFSHSASLCSLFWRPCNPSAYDTVGPVPVQVKAGKTPSSGVLARLSGEPVRERRSSQGVLLNGEPSVGDDELEAGNRVFHESELFVSAIYRDSRGYRRQLANPPKNNTSLFNLVSYGIFVFSVWMLCLVLPFWVWAIFVAVVGYLYSKYSAPVAALQHKVSHQGGRISLSLVQGLLGAPEKYLGFWLGSISVAVLYLVCNICKSAFGTNSMQLRGLDAIDEDSGLFWTCVVALCALISVHTYVVWINVDPGMVQTRESDFDDAMKDSIVAGGTTPSSDVYCRTTLVKKPVRSKFCSGSGFVVARMDHYCVWLNNCVGYGNHRAFYLLLLFHIIGNCCFESLVLSTLVREINRASIGNGWDVAEIIFGRKLFYLIAFCSFLMLVTVGLVALFLEQTINIARNQTTNERMNAARYPWMTDKAGKPHNRFDRGIFTNILEFFCIPGFSVNYFDVFVIPDGVIHNGFTHDGSCCDEHHRANGKLLLQESPVKNKLHGDMEEALRGSDTSEISRPSNGGRNSTTSV